MGFFVSDAIAAASPAAGNEGSLSMIMMLAVFVLFYLVIIRPQNQRAKEQKTLINQLQPGDEVITAAGLLVKIVGLDEKYMRVSLTDGVEVRLLRSAVSMMLPKGTLKSLEQ